MKKIIKIIDNIYEDITVNCWNITWDIFQFFAYHFGKRTPVYAIIDNEKVYGWSITNRFTNHEWFIPKDNRFTYGNFKTYKE